MSEQDPSEKFFQTEPKLPDMYTLWMELAQVAHKLEPFARGDRTPASANQAREARNHLRAARQELIETELFIGAQLDALDDQREQALSDWEQEIDRPDLVQTVEGPVGQEYAPQTDARIEQPPVESEARRLLNRIQSNPQASIRAMSNYAAGVFGSPDCYNCGHPQGTHSGQNDPNRRPGCGTIVEHGYPCDCPEFASGQARPVAEIHGRPVNAREFNDVLDEMDGTHTQSVKQDE